MKIGRKWLLIFSIGLSVSILLSMLPLYHTETITITPKRTKYIVIKNTFLENFMIFFSYFFIFYIFAFVISDDAERWLRNESNNEKIMRKGRN